MSADGMFKRRHPLALLIEIGVVILVFGGVVAGVYYKFRATPFHDVRPLGGENVLVVRSPDQQYEPTVAVAPSTPGILVAASTDERADARIYTSRDRGRTWRSTPAPPQQRAACGQSHPDVAVTGDGLEVVASLVSEVCTPSDPILSVATRRGTTGTWRTRLLRPPRGTFAFDLRPAVEADRGGNIVVVWPRLVGELSSREQLLVTRSKDGGTTWSSPTRIAGYQGVYSLDLVRGTNTHELYLAVADGKRHSVDVLRSADGGATWSRPLSVGRLAEPFLVGCSGGAVIVPAQPKQCVGPRATIAPTRNGLVVVYAEPGAQQLMRVLATRVDRALSSATKPRPIAPEAEAADQFLPVAATDVSTGDVWACYYDTAGDPTRHHAWFTCTLSRDGGRRWAQPVHAASAESNETKDGGDPYGYGQTEGLVAAGGVAHPFWTDDRDLVQAQEDVYTATIPATRLGG